MDSVVSAPSRLPALDALRAAGAAAVVAVHVGFATGFTGSATWGGLIARLDVGVAVFFVLSGFVLFRPFAHAAAHGTGRPGAGRYLWRRALRILPAYWLTVAVCLSVLPDNAGVSFGEWVRYATFTQLYDPGQLPREALGHTWSLAVEAAFYVLLPLLAVPVLGSRWRPRRTALFLCAGGAVVTGGWLAAMATGRLDMGLHTTWLPSFAAWFAAGMALATVHVAAEAGRPSILTEAARAPLACWLFAAGVFVVAGTPLTGPRGLEEPTPAQFAARMVLFLVVAVAVVVPVAFARPGPFASALSTPVTRWLGMVSYGVFLWHPFVLVLLHPAMGAGGLARMAGTYVLTVAGALLLASLSWYGLEQPLQQLGRRLGRVQTPAGARASATSAEVAVAEVAGADAAVPDVVVDGPRRNGSVPSQSTANAASPAS